MQPWDRPKWLKMRFFAFKRHNKVKFQNFLYLKIHFLHELDWPAASADVNFFCFQLSYMEQITKMLLVTIYISVVIVTYKIWKMSSNIISM